MIDVRTLLLTCMVVGFSTSALAAPNCQNPVTQIDINECAVLDFKKADAQLNKLYKELSGSLDADQKQKLKQVQLHWIQYKESQCKYEGDKYAGGSIAGFIIQSCQTRITRQRSAELTEMLKEG